MRAAWWVAASAAVLAACSGGGGEPVRPFGTAPATPHRVSTAAPVTTVDLVSGATTMTVRDADLGPERVRASTPEGSGLLPRLDVVGERVDVHLTQTGGSGPAAVVLELDRRTRWAVRLSGGATSQLLDLRGGRVASVDLLAGATRIELRLPAPDGVVPVRMSGGATELAVHVPPGAAAGVRVGGGAASVVVDGVRRTGVSGGTVVSSSTAADRYDVEATAGVSTLVLDRA